MSLPPSLSPFTHFLSLFISITSLLLPFPPPPPPSLPLSPSSLLHSLSLLSPSQEGATLDFYWTKDSEPLNITNRLSYDSPGTSGTISISEVEEGDGGEYSCRVRTTYQDLVAPQEQTYTFNVTAVPGRAILGHSKYFLNNLAKGHS